MIYIKTMRSHSLVASFLVAVVAMVFTSCSSDYCNVIPSDSIAVMSFDAKRIMSDESSVGDKKEAEIFQDIFHIDGIDGCGINLRDKIYAFETPDGSLGAVAGVDDMDSVESWLKTLADKRLCSGITTRKGYKFAVIKDNFIVGVSKSAILVMGPVVASSQSQAQNRMIKYLDAEDEDGITDTQLFAKLSSIESPIALVAQAEALPEKFLAMLTSGLQSNEDVILSASIAADNGILNVSGEVSSFDAETDAALKSSYKSVTDKYIDYISANTLVAALTSVQGESLVNVMRSDETLRTMLIGLNTAIDIDMMLKSIDGDVLLSIPSVDGERCDFQVIADVDNGDWLSDVDYWKKNTPAGSEITDAGTGNGYRLKSSDMSLYFGLNDGRQLFLSTTSSHVTPSDAPLSGNIKALIQGKRLCVVVNIEELGKTKSQLNTVTDIIAPVLGDMRMAVLSIQ